MKKYKQLIIGILIGAILFGGLSVIANGVKTYFAKQADFPLLVDGVEVKLDMPIVTIEDRTYLPLRAIGNVLGVKVDWNNEKGQAEVITKKNIDKEGENVDSKFITINGKEYINVLDVHKICENKGYALTWAKDTLKWYFIMRFGSPIEREDVLKELGLTEEDVEGISTEKLKEDYGLLLEGECELKLFPEHNKNPYMTREEFENVVLPFINKPEKLPRWENGGHIYLDENGNRYYRFSYMNELLKTIKVTVKDYRQGDTVFNIIVYKVVDGKEVILKENIPYIFISETILIPEDYFLSEILPLDE